MDTIELLTAYNDINAAALSAFEAGYPDAVIGANYSENSTGFFYKITHIFPNQGQIVIIMQWTGADGLTDTLYEKMFFSMEGVTFIPA